MKNTTWPLIAGCVAASIVFGSGSAWVTSKMLLSGSGTSMTPDIVRQVVTETDVKSDVINVVRQAGPSVVSVIVSKELVRYKTNPRDFMMQDPFFGDFFYSPYGGQRQPSVRVPQLETEKTQIAGGTGFIVTADGKVITNKHVVADPAAEYTVVMSDGVEHGAKVLSRDPSNDLAVIQIVPRDGQTLQNLKPLRLADAGSVQVGQVIVAIGNALGEFDNTVTMGVISAKGRSIVASDGRVEGIEQLSNLLQTDAAINPGNSGGPLLSLDGSVVGVSTAIAQSANGIGFAIPVDEVDFVLRSVNKYGKIVRPYLGVVYRTNSPELAKQFNLPVDHGAILQDSIETGDPAVVKDGPAAKAGLKSGDVILSINGDKLTKDRDLKDTLTKFLPDDEVTLAVQRGGENLSLKLKLGKREDTSVSQDTPVDGSSTSEAYLGVFSTPITPELQKKLQLPMSEGALLYNDFAGGIPAVMQDSPAARAGLRAGDILVSVAGEKITADRTLTSIIEEKKPGDTIEVLLRRDGREEKLTVTLGERPKNQ